MPTYAHQGFALGFSFLLLPKYVFLNSRVPFLFFERWLSRGVQGDKEVEEPGEGEVAGQVQKVLAST